MSATQEQLDEMNRPLTPEEQEAVDKLQALVNEERKTGFFPNTNPLPNRRERRAQVKQSHRNLIRQVAPVKAFSNVKTRKTIENAKRIIWHRKPFPTMDYPTMWKEINQQPVSERPFARKGKII